MKKKLNDIFNRLELLDTFIKANNTDACLAELLAIKDDLKTLDITLNPNLPKPNLQEGLIGAVKTFEFWFYVLLESRDMDDVAFRKEYIESLRVLKAYTNEEKP